jgi:hypothetical protein
MNMLKSSGAISPVDVELKTNSGFHLINQLHDGGD